MAELKCACRVSSASSTKFKSPPTMSGFGISGWVAKYVLIEWKKVADSVPLWPSRFGA